METKTLYRYGLAAAVLLAIAVAISWITSTKPAFASAPSGLPATVFQVTSTSVGTTATQLVATTTTCAARIVTTTGSAVMIGFTALNGTTTSGSNGVWQPASTTVAYDSGLYGCGQLSVYSYATALVNVIATR